VNTISDIGVPFIEGVSVRERFVAAIAAIPRNTIPNTLQVFLVREPFDDFYLLIYDKPADDSPLGKADRQSEELEDAEVRQWLEDHGATEDQIQKSVVQAWNFYSSMVTIVNPKTPKTLPDPIAPQIT
jgi:hypothetical protein